MFVVVNWLEYTCTGRVRQLNHHGWGVDIRQNLHEEGRLEADSHWLTVVATRDGLVSRYREVDILSSEADAVVGNNKLEGYIADEYGKVTFRYTGTLVVEREYVE